MELDQKIASDLFDLRELINVLIKRWWIIILLSVIAFTPSYIYLRIAPKKYDSMSKFVFRTNSSTGSGGISAMASLMGVKVGGEDNNETSRLDDHLFSKAFMRSLADSTYPTDSAGPFKGKQIHIWELWKMKPDTTNPKSMRAFYAGICGRLMSVKDRYVVHISQPTGTHLLITSFEDPSLSNAVNQRILFQLKDLFETKMKFKARENTVFIQQRLEEAQADLRRAENRQSQWMERNKAFGDPSLSLEKDRLSRDIAVCTELFLQAKKQFELSKIEEMREIPVIEIIDPSEDAFGPSKPNRRQILFIGSLFAIFFSVFAVLAFEFLLNFFRNWRHNQRPHAASTPHP